MKGSWDAGREINWSAAAGIFVLSLLLCVSFAYFAKPLPVTDEFLTYYRVATNVSDGKGFTEDGSRPYVYLPPLFSCALGGWFTLVGSRSIFAVQLYQSLCLALSALFTFFLARELFPLSEKPAVAASLWVALHPSLWTYAVFVRQEPTILLATTIACWRTVIWLNNPGRVRAVLTGACWGITTLAKAVTLFLPILLLFLWFWRGRKKWRMIGGETGLAVLAFLAVLAPWTVRNYLQFQRIIPVNDQLSGILEWNVRHSDPPANEEKVGVGLLAAHSKMANAMNVGPLAGEKYLADLDHDGVKGKERERRLWNYILFNKKYFLVQRVPNAIFFAAPCIDWWVQSGRLGTGGVLTNPVYWLFALLYHAPLYFSLAFLTVRLLRGGLAPSLSFLVTFFLCYLGVYTILWGETRFSLPVYPVLILFAPWELLFRPKETAATDGPAIGTPRA